MMRLAMRQSRIAYHADFVVYPALIVGTILAIAAWRSPQLRVIALGIAAAGIVLWTLLEYLLHRFVLHGDTRIGGLHDQHHARPRAWIGTPTWLSITAIACFALMPILLGAPAIVGLSLAAGLMAGFLWYALTHHVIHHGNPQFLARVLAGATRHHFEHHRQQGIGNFGVTTRLWDRLFRTSLSALTPTGHSEARARAPELGGGGR
jgi:sterol desaturase/sphingolipid hydroxylase (fatty acid hydroxylase superfamily)